MSRWCPIIQVDRPRAERWLATKGWERDPKFPFAPMYLDPKFPEKTLDLQTAVDRQMMRENGD